MPYEGGEISEAGGGHKGIKIFGKRLPVPLLLIGGGGIVLVFLAARGKTAKGSPQLQSMPTPPGGPNADFGFSGFSPVTGQPIPAGAFGFNTSSLANPSSPVPVDAQHMDMESASMQMIRASMDELTAAKTDPGGLTTPAPAPATVDLSSINNRLDALQAMMGQKTQAQQTMVHAHPVPEKKHLTGLERTTTPHPHTDAGYDRREDRLLQQRNAQMRATMQHGDAGPHKGPEATKPHPVLGVHLPAQFNHNVPVPPPSYHAPSPAPAPARKAPTTQPKSLPHETVKSRAARKAARSVRRTTPLGGTTVRTNPAWGIKWPIFTKR